MESHMRHTLMPEQLPEIGGDAVASLRSAVRLGNYQIIVVVHLTRARHQPLLRLLLCQVTLKIGPGNIRDRQSALT